MLTGRQKRALRALGHPLHPTVQIGQRGLTAEVSQKVDAELTAHELIKVRVGQELADDVGTLALQAADGSSSQLVQVIGRTFLLYRRHPEEPHIELP